MPLHLPKPLRSKRGKMIFAAALAALLLVVFIRRNKTAPADASSASTADQSPADTGTYSAGSSAGGSGSNGGYDFTTQPAPANSSDAFNQTPATDNPIAAQIVQDALSAQPTPTPPTSRPVKGSSAVGAASRPAFHGYYNSGGKTYFQNQQGHVAQATPPKGAVVLPSKPRPGAHPTLPAKPAPTKPGAAPKPAAAPRPPARPAATPGHVVTSKPAAAKPAAAKPAAPPLAHIGGRAGETARPKAATAKPRR